MFQYNIQKKEDGMQFDMGNPNAIGANRKKTPEELAKEMHAEDDSENFIFIPSFVQDIQHSIACSFSVDRTIGPHRTCREGEDGGHWRTRDRERLFAFRQIS